MFKSLTSIYVIRNDTNLTTTDRLRHCRRKKNRNWEIKPRTIIEIKINSIMQRPFKYETF